MSYSRSAGTDGTLRLTLWQVDLDQDIVQFDRRKNIGLHRLALEVESEEALDGIAEMLSSISDVVVEFIWPAKQ